MGVQKKECIVMDEKQGNKNLDLVISGLKYCQSLLSRLPIN